MAKGKSKPRRPPLRTSPPKTLRIVQRRRDPKNAEGDVERGEDRNDLH
jgi:hypothetical protein